MFLGFEGEHRCMSALLTPEGSFFLGDIYDAHEVHAFSAEDSALSVKHGIGSLLAGISRAAIKPRLG